MSESKIQREFKIQRYTWDHLEEWYHPDPTGEWVKWKDVKPLLSFMVGKLNNVLDDLKSLDDSTQEALRKARKNYPPIIVYGGKTEEVK